MFELTLTGVKKYMDATLVLKDVTFGAYAGEKVGIVGVNGSGKTTILKLIAGVLPMNYWPGYPQTSSYGYDEGFIRFSRKATCSYLEQIPQYDDNVKVIDILNLAFEDVYVIEKKMRVLEEEMNALEEAALEKALKQYSELVQLYEVKGGYEIQEKLAKICTGLNFDDSFLHKDFSCLSGGEKTTVVLGKLLMLHPDILLLDEPTNHLDMASIEWLETYLKNYSGIIVIVSHDRYFLDNVVTKIVEIEDMESICYRGNYSAYAKQKEENMRIQYEHFREQQKKIQSMEKTVHDLRDWAARADNNKFFRRAASIQIKLDKLDRIEKPVFKKQNMKLNLNAAQRSGSETIKIKGLVKSFGEKVLFKNAELLIKFGEKAALIGPNGSGKTTLIKMLLGEERPDAGSAEFGANVMAAYLPQKITFHNEELTVLDCFREDNLIYEGKAREYLSKFMFFGKSVFKKVKHLSGGEKIRLKLAMLLFHDVNVLILDEPTNHLDIDSIETFEEALEEFNGTLLFTSHDRYFINKIGEKVIAIENHAFKSYPGNYDCYKNAIDALNLQTQKKPEIKAEKAKTLKKSDDGKKKDKEKAEIETKIAKLEAEIRELDAAEEVSGVDYKELSLLYTRKEALKEELNGVLELWLSLNS